MTDAAPTHPLAGILGGKPPRRDTYEGWQYYCRSRRSFVPAPRLSLEQWQAMSDRDKALHNLHRTATHVNMPLQETPMAKRVASLVDRRIRGNAMRLTSATWPGVMVFGLGYQGKTETVCDIAAEFEVTFREAGDQINPHAMPGTRALHAPVVYVQTPVTATPKSTCQAILDFFGAHTKGLTLPQLVQQVAASLDDHGVRALILDDITRLRMHRADDQDVLDLIRAFMSMNVTLVLIGADIPGSGLLRKARWDSRARQWVFPPSASTRVHGLEVTQTERRFDLVELGTFEYTTPEGIEVFRDHLAGLEDGLRLFNAWPGMLTGGTMPEYLMRRTNGVIGLLARLIEDGAMEAIASEKEFLDEELLDTITISLDALGRDPGAGEIPIVPDLSSSQEKKPPTRRQKRPRNTVFDDAGPRAAAGGA
ncbi:AAA family ATPase [Kitasatospora sp. NPDC048296]|uniref:AAA family ATPase n=1 Tax=Kitasatospora sp. NPDC048296 TaxID=3364048 RepID=UPI003717D304